MKEFMLFFRADQEKMKFNSQEDWKAEAKRWQDWMDGIKAKDRWGAHGLQLSPNGKVIKEGNIVTDGPYADVKELLISYCTIKAETLEEAAELSKNCPILLVGGNIEIREMVREYQ